MTELSYLGGNYPFKMGPQVTKFSLKSEDSPLKYENETHGRI